MTDWFAIARRFGRPEVVGVPAPLFSGYVLSGMSDALQKLHLPPHYYILGVTYRLADEKENCTGDSQLCITGTAAPRESALSACAREVREETLILPAKFRHLLRITNSNFSVNWYACSMKNARLGSRRDSEPESAGGHRNKVGCIIYGTYDEALELLARMPVIDTSSDNIAGVICVRITEAVKICELSRTYAKLDRFFWCGDGINDIYAFTGKLLPQGGSRHIKNFSAGLFNALSDIERLPCRNSNSDAAVRATMDKHKRALSDAVLSAVAAPIGRKKTLQWYENILEQLNEHIEYVAEQIAARKLSETGSA